MLKTLGNCLGFLVGAVMDGLMNDNEGNSTQGNGDTETYHQDRMRDFFVEQRVRVVANRRLALRGAVSNRTLKDVLISDKFIRLALGLDIIVQGCDGGLLGARQKPGLIRDIRRFVTSSVRLEFHSTYTLPYLYKMMKPGNLRLSRKFPGLVREGYSANGAGTPGVKDP